MILIVDAVSSLAGIVGLSVLVERRTPTKHRNTDTVAVSRDDTELRDSFNIHGDDDDLDLGLCIDRQDGGTSPYC